MSRPEYVPIAYERGWSVFAIKDEAQRRWGEGAAGADQEPTYGRLAELSDTELVFAALAHHYDPARDDFADNELDLPVFQTEDTLLYPVKSGHKGGQTRVTHTLEGNEIVTTRRTPIKAFSELIAVRPRKPVGFYQVAATTVLEEEAREPFEAKAHQLIGYSSKLKPVDFADNLYRDTHASDTKLVLTSETELNMERVDDSFSNPVAYRVSIGGIMRVAQNPRYVRVEADGIWESKDSGDIKLVMPESAPVTVTIPRGTEIKLVDGQLMALYPWEKTGDGVTLRTITLDRMRITSHKQSEWQRLGDYGMSEDLCLPQFKPLTNIDLSPETIKDIVDQLDWRNISSNFLKDYRGALDGNVLPFKREQKKRAATAAIHQAVTTLNLDQPTDFLLAAPMIVDHILPY